MKRSEINAIMRKAVRFAEDMRFRLPPFAFWNGKDWHDKGTEYDELRQNMLGWDITDFGSGVFYKVGLLMFTIRNGNFDNPKYTKPYAEKLLVVEERQVTPYHFHYRKMEDIINRGGGNLMVQVYNSGKDERETPVTISMDGRSRTIKARTVIRVTPGESITIPSGLYHTFWGEEGHGTVLVGEISNVNDDRVDNHFYEPVGRFPELEEDEAPLFLLYTDYKDFFKVTPKEGI